MTASDLCSAEYNEIPYVPWLKCARSTSTLKAKIYECLCTCFRGGHNLDETQQDKKNRKFSSTILYLVAFKDSMKQKVTSGKISIILPAILSTENYLHPSGVRGGLTSLNFQVKSPPENNLKLQLRRISSLLLPNRISSEALAAELMRLNHPPIVFRFRTLSSQ
uniref:Uncharacterized protein n=1 Tax=Glossina palpalis gambiensis TaxID=67801 RepID=A0A1B0ASL8_9MUSC